MISAGFLIFCALIVFFYRIAPGRLRTAVLCAANLGFMYLAGGREGMLLLVLSLLAGYTGCLVVESTRGWMKTVWFAIFLTGIFALLALCRYVPFFLAQGGLQVPVWLPEVPGISFYTLTIAACLIQVYWGGMRAERSVVRFTAFAGFFPTLSSGPVMDPPSMLRQFRLAARPDYNHITSGAQRILWGFFKKLVISERLAVLVIAVYGDYHTYSGWYILMATGAFALQLYTDFSGCMDIACGAGEMLGFTLPENFDLPFLAETESELWRRWHITLGEWFKNYVMYPLLKSPALLKVRELSISRFGKRKGKQIPPRIAMLVLWFLIGFWHGGGLKFIIGSGLLHACLMILGQLLEPAAHRINVMLHVTEGGTLNRWFRRARTFLCLCSGFVFFRADTFRDALGLYRGMFSGNRALFSAEGYLALGLDGKDSVILVLSLFLLFALERLHRKASVRSRVSALSLPVRWTLYLAMFLCVAVFGMYGPGYQASAFIYAKF